MALKIEEYR